MLPRCSHILRRLTVDAADTKSERVTVEPTHADFPTKFDRGWSSIGRPQRNMGEIFAALLPEKKLKKTSLCCLHQSTRLDTNSSNPFPNKQSGRSQISNKGGWWGGGGREPAMKTVWLLNYIYFHCLKKNI